MDLRCRALAEGPERLLFGIKNLEDGEQLRHLQQVSDALGQVGQLDSATCIVSGGVESHQRAQPTRIDVTYAAQVEYDLVLPREQFLDGVAELRRLLSEDDAAVTVHDQDVIDFASRKFELHGEISPSALRTRSPRRLPLCGHLCKSFRPAE